MKFWTECLRVLKITKKPDKQEFSVVLKISGIGLLVIGFLGFVVHTIFQIIG